MPPGGPAAQVLSILDHSPLPTPSPGMMGGAGGGGRPGSAQRLARGPSPSPSPQLHPNALAPQQSPPVAYSPSSNQAVPISQYE